MRSFWNNCRRLAVVSGIVVLGAMMSTLTPSSAQAQGMDEWMAKSFSTPTKSPRTARRMRLGADQPTRARESLTGGSPRISRGKSSRKAQSAQRRRGVRVASLGESYRPDPRPGPSLAGGGVRWVANSGCLNSSLRAVIYQVANSFGPVTVNSTCRSRRHNARVGGAHRSHHLNGNAVDFRVRGNNRAVLSFLRSHGSVGGLKLYRGGFFHIDTGSRRSW
jgi:hypothetical protein